MDFTIAKYKELCKALSDKHQVITFNEFITKNNTHNRFVILRHDVDRSIAKASKNG